MSRRRPAVDILVARRIAAMRREVGLTLRELSAKTGLSDAYLSRVEHGRTAVTLATLQKLADVFATPMAAFFEQEEPARRLVLCRSDQGRRVRFRGPKGTLVELLADAKSGKMMEPLLVNVSSGSQAAELIAHAGEEFNYVIHGRCRLLFGDDRHDLGPGDSVYFDAGVPHATHAVGPEPCQLLAVVTSRDFSMHRNVAKVIEGRIQA